MRIVITDSGLGGLSVVAELEKRLNELPIFESAELIFFNSLYSSKYGYNSNIDFSEKVTIFNNALTSIEANYNPDLILIACNTLSVIFPHTEFASNSKINIKGILDCGINLFRNSIKNSDEKTILFGTPTTINSNVYKDELIKLGINEAQIINQACPNLETQIQNNPNSIETQNSINRFVKEAVKKLGSIPQKTHVGFCCTHYGYSESLFANEFYNNLKSDFEILNPNNKMIDFLFAETKKLYSHSNVAVKVVSQVELKKSEIELLSNILITNSPKTTAALRNYEFIKNLFAKEQNGKESIK
ncbi:MAG: hypothetical protein L3J41_03015 [Melioribacteraceae bacterium]|nr:hypothetical protein [Melioribacteraceae bacterium]